MKKWITCLLAFCLMFGCFSSAYADEPAVGQAESLASGTCGENLTWVLSDGGVLQISGTGAMTNYTYESRAPWFSKRSNITSVVIDAGVTSIGDYAFRRCRSLKEVSIPDSVTTIGTGAFFEASELQGMTLSGSVISIGQNAFNSCRSMAYIMLPGSLTSIGEGAFNSCRGLTEISIPESITRIERHTFIGCSHLIKVTIPGSVSDIGDGAFNNCRRLQEITIPEGVSGIGSGAFELCLALRRVTVPASVTDIGDHAFGFSDSYSGSLLEKFVLYGYIGSAAEAYAAENGVAFVHLDCGHSFGADGLCASCGDFVFLDISPNMTVYKPIKWAYQQGIVNVGEDRIFAPDTPCTRSEFTLMIYRMAGNPKVTERQIAACPFIDLPEDPEERRAIVWAYTNRIITGATETTFAPSGNIRRAQIVVMLYRLAGKPGVSGLTTPFGDISNLSQGVQKAITWAYNNKITTGTGAGYAFTPKGRCTRSQLTTFLYKYDRL